MSFVALDYESSVFWEYMDVNWDEEDALGLKQNE